jgi:sterol desaturase/sphingolipid hydroxylase (fatty acid hydroxylase superfamily)
VSRIALFWTCFLGFGLLCTIAELVWPARKVHYGKALPLDLVAFALYQFVMFPAAVEVTDPIYGYIHVPHVVTALWLPLRVAMFYLAADLGSYWMHRLMHTRYVWYFHRWHHASKQLYWFTGVRATIPQQILFNLPYIVALPVLAGAPTWVYLALMVEGVFRNHWMHMNVAWRSNWLELVFVTPRYHHIHHAADPTHHHGNYGSLFSLWDRLFGTYVNPDDKKLKKFGIAGKPVDPVRLMIGI